MRNNKLSQFLKRFIVLHNCMNKHWWNLPKLFWYMTIVTLYLVQQDYQPVDDECESLMDIIFSLLNDLHQYYNFFCLIMIIWNFKYHKSIKHYPYLIIFSSILVSNACCCNMMCFTSSNCNIMCHASLNCNVLFLLKL